MKIGLKDECRGKRTIYEAYILNLIFGDSFLQAYCLVHGFTVRICDYASVIIGQEYINGQSVRVHMYLACGGQEQFFMHTPLAFTVSLRNVSDIITVSVDT